MPSTRAATFASSKKSSKKSPMRKNSSASGRCRFTRKYCSSIGDERPALSTSGPMWRRMIGTTARRGDVRSAGMPPPRRMLAFDLDGTFLERDGTLAEATAQLLRAAALRGVELVPATGRRLHSALPLLERAGLTGHCVVHNGAMVAEVATARTIRTLPIEGEHVRALVALIRERRLAPLLFTAAPRGP